MESETGARYERGAREHVEDSLGRIEPAELTQALAGFARENPHVALAAAAGIGFLLGGGLTPRVLGVFGMVATRSYLRGTILQAMQELLKEHVEAREQAG